jgi:4'-phosphopantetheinyl transferase
MPMEDAAAVPVQWMPPPPPAAAAGGRRVFAEPVGLCRLVADFEVCVIGIQGDADRDHARLAIREAIVATLGRLGGLPSERIVLRAEPGTPPYAVLDTPAGLGRAWLAISHDGALSVAAISRQGAVGIDVTQVADAAAFPDWEAVARDFLGPAVVAALIPLPPAERMLAFARAWTEREARLKYLGRELVEWSADGDAPLHASRCLPLALPDGYVGALVLPP